MTTNLESKCKPNFFVAGMPRSGTTSLYTYLKQHPEIYLSVYKEPHFFSKDLTQNIYNIQDEELYNSLFEGSADKKAVGEGSVWYLTSKIAAAEIKKFNPGAKIIVMLRDPVEMIYSLHALYVRTGNENIPDFQEALDMVPVRMKGQAIPEKCYFPEGLFYTEVAKYHDKIKGFLDVFGLKQTHFVIFDDFARDTARSFRETLEFLDVDPGFLPEFDLQRASEVIRKIVIEQIRHSHPEVKKMLSRKTGKDTHMGPQRPPLAPELKSHLQQLFKEDIEKTSQLIDSDLSHWYK